MCFINLDKLNGQTIRAFCVLMYHHDGLFFIHKFLIASNNLMYTKNKKKELKLYIQVFICRRACTVDSNTYYGTGEVIRSSQNPMLWLILAFSELETEHSSPQPMNLKKIRKIPIKRALFRYLKICGPFYSICRYFVFVSNLISNQFYTDNQFK